MAPASASRSIPASVSRSVCAWASTSTRRLCFPRAPRGPEQEGALVLNRAVCTIPSGGLGPECVEVTRSLIPKLISSEGGHHEEEPAQQGHQDVEVSGWEP